jgi:acyl dehydratase
VGRRLIDPVDLPSFLGQELGVSRWLKIDQNAIDAFGSLTHDHQWIHSDVRRAMRDASGTIAHGFLTLSMMSTLVSDIWVISGTKRTINYGFNKLRMPAPVPSGARIRLRETLRAVDKKPDGLLITRDSCVEVEGQKKPAVIAEWIAYLVL